MSVNISLQRYTEKSLVIRGETTPIKSKMMDLGGKFGYYGGQPGWMFHISKEDVLRKVFPFPQGYSEGPQRNPLTAPPQAPTEIKLPDVIIQKTPARGGLRMRVDPETEAPPSEDLPSFRPMQVPSFMPPNNTEIKLPFFEPEPTTKKLLEIMGMMNGVLKTMTEELGLLRAEIVLLRGEMKSGLPPFGDDLGSGPSGAEPSNEC